MRQPYPWHHHLICIVPTLVMVAFLFLFFSSEEGILSFFVLFREAHPTFTEVVRVFTNAGRFFLYAPFVALLVRGLRAGDCGKIRFIIFFTIAFVSVLLMTYAIKNLVGRGRPYVDPGAVRDRWNYDFETFPSGHTTEAVGLATGLAGVARRYWTDVVLGLVAGLIALSRLYLGVHYTTDVLGGVFMGSLAGFCTWLLYSRDRFRILLDGLFAGKSREL